MTDWHPPLRLSYLWHVARDRADATLVEIRFAPVGLATTRVEIKHDGCNRLGDAAALWRDRNQIGWDSLLPHYLTASAKKGA